MNHEDSKDSKKEPNRSVNERVLPRETERCAAEIVDAALRVHSALGPGLLESAYETCLAHELGKRGLRVDRQVGIPLLYDGVRIEAGFRLDMIVDEVVAVELKAVERMLPLFDAQMLTYLKLAQLHLGFLINFNVPLIKQGIRRFVI